MSVSKPEKRAMTHRGSPLSTLRRAGALPAALLVGSVAVLAPVTRASAGEDESSAEDESTTTTNASEDTEASEALRGPPDLHAPALRGPPRLHARKAPESDGAESSEAAASDDSRESGQSSDEAGREVQSASTQNPETNYGNEATITRNGVLVWGNEPQEAL